MGSDKPSDDRDGVIPPEATGAAPTADAIEAEAPPEPPEEAGQDRADLETEPPKSGDMGRQAADGAIWSTISYGLGQALRLLSNLILTRLLLPEAFGLMAIVNVFVIGLHLFSDIGINASIIQNKRGDDPRFLDTAWALQIVRGFALFGISWLISPLVAQVYEAPELGMLIPLAASSAVVDGFVSTKRWEAHRNVQLKRMAVLEVTSQFIALVVMVALGFMLRSVWALAVAGVVQGFVAMIMSHTYLPGHNNRLRWDKEDLKEIISFGRWVFLSTVATFFSGYTDRLLLGKLIPMALLGVYGIGSNLAGLPRILVSKIAGTVLFPVLSRVYHDDESTLGETFHRARMPILVASGWCLAGFIAGGQVIIDILYDETYANAGWVVQLISMGSWLTTLSICAEYLFLAQGRPRINVAASFTHLAAMLVFIPLGEFLGSYFGGPEGVGGFFGAVTGYALTEFVKLAFFTTRLVKDGMARLRIDLLMTGALLGSAGLVYVVERHAASVEVWGWPRSVVSVFLEEGHASWAPALTATDGLFRVLIVFVLTTLLWAPGLFSVGRAFVRTRRG